MYLVNPTSSSGVLSEGGGKNSPPVSSVIEMLVRHGLNASQNYVGGVGRNGQDNLSIFNEFDIRKTFKPIAGESLMAQ